jgi:hypothetical protein
MIDNFGRYLSSCFLFKTFLRLDSASIVKEIDTQLGPNDTYSPYLRIGTSFVDWAQLSRFSSEDGERIQSPKHCF